MKKHYTFIPIKENDISSFRKALIGSLWFRPCACILTLIALGLIGYFKRDILTEDGFRLILFALAVGIVVYAAASESAKLHQAAALHKSSLLPFIHTKKEDDSFYSEELANGFIIQTEPVNYVDISESRDVLLLLAADCQNHSKLIAYLESCIDSPDEKLINKGVIYIEIIHLQLEKGNKDILATYDKLKNCKEELL